MSRYRLYPTPVQVAVLREHCAHARYYQAPGPLSTVRLQRGLARCQRGSNRRDQARQRLAKIRARDADRRKDWAEKASTTIARSYDLIRIEDLKIKNMTRSAAGTLAEPGTNVAG